MADTRHPTRQAFKGGEAAARGRLQPEEPDCRFGWNCGHEPSSLASPLWEPADPHTGTVVRWNIRCGMVAEGDLIERIRIDRGRRLPFEPLQRLTLDWIVSAIAP
jgi:hypothetical protein